MLYIISTLFDMMNFMCKINLKWRKHFHTFLQQLHNNSFLIKTLPGVNLLKVVQSSLMSRELTVNLDWGGFPQMFLAPLPQGPWGFSNVFIPTVNCWALVMVNYFTFLFLWVLVLGLNQKLFESYVSLVMGMYTIFTAYVFDALLQSWMYGMTLCPTLALPLGGLFAGCFPWWCWFLVLWYQHGYCC